MVCLTPGPPSLRAAWGQGGAQGHRVGPRLAHAALGGGPAQERDPRPGLGSNLSTLAPLASFPSPILSTGFEALQNPSESEPRLQVYLDVFSSSEALPRFLFLNMGLKIYRPGLRARQGKPKVKPYLLRNIWQRGAAGVGETSEKPGCSGVKQDRGFIAWK